MSYAKPEIFPRQYGKRVTRTREMIMDHFRVALAQTEFEAIKMQNLANSCGLCRQTLYRSFASTSEVLWAVTYPQLDAALSSAFRADRATFIAQFSSIQATPGLCAALVSPGARSVREKFTVLATARAETLTRRRQATGFGALLAGAWFAAFDECAVLAKDASETALDLYSLTYVAAFITPRGLGQLVRGAPVATSGRFPAAVSVAESLSNENYIISMIDGRPYRTLSRHLARFGMTPDDYRRCFDLSPDYPMVAPSYSAVRRKIAERIFRTPERDMSGSTTT